jgi:hypothetical protein
MKAHSSKKILQKCFGQARPLEILSNFWFGSQKVRFMKKSMRIHTCIIPHFPNLLNGSSNEFGLFNIGDLIKVMETPLMQIIYFKYDQKFKRFPFQTIQMI